MHLQYPVSSIYWIVRDLIDAFTHTHNHVLLPPALTTAPSFLSRVLWSELSLRFIGQLRHVIIWLVPASAEAQT